MDENLPSLEHVDDNNYAISKLMSVARVFLFYMLLVLSVFPGLSGVVGVSAAPR